MSQESSGLDLTEEENIEKTVCVEAEADVIAGALQNVLRGLLDDPTFHESIQSCLGNEPVPYFHQFTDKPPVRSEPPEEPTIPIMTFEGVSTQSRRSSKEGSERLGSLRPVSQDVSRRSSLSRKSPSVSGSQSALEAPASPVTSPPVSERLQPAVESPREPELVGLIDPETQRDQVYIPKYQIKSNTVYLNQ